MLNRDNKVIEAEVKEDITLHRRRVIFGFSQALKNLIYPVK